MRCLLMQMKKKEPFWVLQRCKPHFTRNRYEERRKEGEERREKAKKKKKNNSPEISLSPPFFSLLSLNSLSPSKEVTGWI